jgi:hypothetical protein
VQPLQSVPVVYKFEFPQCPLPFTDDGMEHHSLHSPLTSATPPSEAIPVGQYWQVLGHGFGAGVGAGVHILQSVEPVPM